MTEGGGNNLVQAFAKLSAERYEVAVHEHFGLQGVDALVRLLESTRELLKHVPYEMLTDGLQVVVPVDPAHSLDAEGGASHQQLSDLGGRAYSALSVALTGATAHRVWNSEAVEFTCAGPVLVYRYVHGEREEILVEGTAWEVNDSPWACGMATPSFAKLETALAHYVAQNRVPVQCGHLEKMWRDGSRLGFVEKPEKHMRRSLLLALSYALENATVRPEQNQSETKPVDIEVTWWGIKRSAIIEIKWLGDSGPVGANAFTTSYTQARAVSGLRQLADYLDLRDATTSDVPVMGYLFVFDGRRRNLTAVQTSISRADGFHYAMSDPNYPADLLQRPDLGAPFRCFMEPICA